MKQRSSTKFYAILALGLVLIGGAWAARQQILASRRAAVDPRIKALEVDAARLNARAAAAPQDTKTRWQLADTYQKLGQFDAAANQLEVIAHNDPNDKNAWIALGNTYLALKQLKKAEQIYRDTTNRWPKSAEGWQGLAAVLYQQDQYRDAMDAGEKAVKLTPADPNNHYILAASALEYALEYPDPQSHESELKLAQTEFEKLTKVWPLNGDIYYRLGRIQKALNHRKDAVQDFQHALQLTPTEPIYSSLIGALVATGDRPGALRTAEEGVAQYPDAPVLHDLVGQTLQTSGEPASNEKSLSEFEKAVQLAPHNESYQEHLGTAYLRVNRMQDARKAFEMAVVLDPDRVFPFQQLSAIYTRMGDPARATLAAKEARNGLYNADLLVKVQDTLRQHPENVALHLAVADRYRELGRNGATREEYEAALRLDPQNKHATAGIVAVTGVASPASEDPGAGGPSSAAPTH